MGFGVLLKYQLVTRYGKNINQDIWVLDVKEYAHNVHVFVFWQFTIILIFGIVESMPLEIFECHLYTNSI